MKYRPVDLAGVQTYPLAERKNKVIMAKHRAGAVRAGMTVAELLAALPDQLGSQLARQLRQYPRAHGWGLPTVRRW